jgi:hypothetical protein
LLLDPEQLGDGRHDLSVRLTRGGRPGPSYTTSISVPFDMLRSVRAWLRSWGAVASVLVLINALIATFVVVALARRRGTSPRSEFVPTLQLRPTTDGLYVGPSVIEFPPRGKLRIGYHPPFKDNDVGSREFASLPHCDIRGDDEAVKELSRHVACIWRDEKTNDCYIHLGWAGPGEPIRPKAQTQVLHFGRPQDATSEPFRLAHRDVVRLAPRVEYVFTQVGLRDKPTPERKKTESFSPTSTAATPVDRALSMPRLALLEAERRRLSGEVVETLDED